LALTLADTDFDVGDAPTNGIALHFDFISSV
jgi:hypothetical protein